jgi:hypothetical protein
MKVPYQMINQVVDLKIWFPTSHYTFKIQGFQYLGRVKNEKQKAMDVACNFCKSADLDDKDSPHEHHDLIVGKDYRVII